MPEMLIPPPVWTELPAGVQNDLASRGFDVKWFAASDGGADDEVRLTVLNLYAKLRSVKISGILGWDHIGKRLWTGKGSFKFLTNEQRLKDCLRQDQNFANPNLISITARGWTTAKYWDSRELQAWGSLHFRGESTQVCAVHIDPAGLASAPGILGKLDPRAWVAHWDTYKNDRWADVNFIRRILVRQGYSRDLLQL